MTNSNIKYSLFDLHCDTPYKLHSNSANLINNSLHIDLTRAKIYEKYVQFTAIYNNHNLSDKAAYEKFLKIYDTLINQINKAKDLVVLCKSSQEIENAIAENKRAFVLTIEDAKILEGDINRLQEFYDLGARFLTLVWRGESIIGGGFDLHEVGLTDFGRATVKKCFEIGIVPDISHSSLKTADEIHEISLEYGKPYIASHSNSYSVRQHDRNLHDYQFKNLIKVGGIAGISLCPFHITDLDEKYCTIEHIVCHILHYLDLGGEKTVCIGGDLDGTSIPSEFRGVEDLYKIGDALLSKNIKQSTVEDIFFNNAFNFVKNNI